MTGLEQYSKLKRFTHIYYEPEAADYALARRLFAAFPGAARVEIGRYKDFFCRSSQDFRLQKHATALILAVKRGNFLYEGPSVCQNFGNTRFYYASSALNCLYDCDYCYLQGAFRSANLVFFVNISDFFRQVDLALEKGPLYLTVSYDTDLLAMESILPLSAEWISYASGKAGLLLELRTKSANYSAISGLPPSGNVVLAWTLSPGEIVERYEKGTPSLEARLKSAKEAVRDGWRVRLCFDPLIRVKNWREAYSTFIKKVFSAIPAEGVLDASAGAFRMSEGYLRSARRAGRGSELLFYPHEVRGGVASYPEKAEKEIVGFVKNALSEYLPAEKIFT